MAFPSNHYPECMAASDAAFWEDPSASNQQPPPPDVEYPIQNTSLYPDPVLSGVWNPSTALGNAKCTSPESHRDDPLSGVCAPSPGDFNLDEWVNTTPSPTPEPPSVPAVNIPDWRKQAYTGRGYVPGQNNRSLVESVATSDHAQPKRNSADTRSGTMSGTRSNPSSNSKSDDTSQTSVSQVESGISSSQASDVGGPDPYRCDHCGRTFDTPGDKRHHLRWLKESEMKHTCRKCLKKFVNPGHRDRHETTHAKKKVYPFECQGCDARYTRKDNLLRHQQKKQHSGMRQ